MNLRSLTKTSLLILAFLVGSVHLVAAQASTKTPGAAATGAPETTYAGGKGSPPLAKPKFTLTDTSGEPYDFASKTQGYVTLLFFGYTHCPDMCPIQMYLMA